MFLIWIILRVWISSRCNACKRLKNDVNTLQKTVTSLNNQVENDTKFIPFTITPTVSNSSSYQIASTSEMKQIFGSDAGVVNSGAIIMNGDGDASPVHFERSYMARR